MQIHVQANRTVQTTAAMEQWVRSTLEQALARFAPDLSSLEVHLADTNSERVSADHMRCLIEARINGREPLAVSHQAERLDEALHGASDKLRRALDSELGRLHELRRGRSSIRRDLGPGAA